MRMPHTFAGGALIGIGLLCGCGGGGGSVPAASHVVVAGVAPAPDSGFVAATGALTMVAGGSAFGSTLLPSSAAAILTLDSSVMPAQPAVGAALGSTPIAVSETIGLAAASGARWVRRIARPPLPARDRDARVPDGPDVARMAQRLRELEGRSADTLRAAASRQSLHVYAPGERRTFLIQAGTINATAADPTPIAMPATLVAQSTHANVWLDDAVLNDPATLTREYPSGNADFAAVARAFETTFAVETQAFGPAYTTAVVNFEECDAHGSPLAGALPRPDTTGVSDPHINVVISDELQGSGEGGYFYGLDMLNTAEANCVAGAVKPATNGMPMIVIGSDRYAAYAGDAANTYPANDEAYWLTGDMPQTIAHEFQHYLHFINKYLQQHIADPGNPNAGTLDDSYIDEGCSVLAQDLVAGAALDRRESPVFVRAFLLEPANVSLTAFTGYAPNVLDSSSSTPPYGYYRNTLGNYGYAYLFVRYLYDRFGPGALKAIYAQTNPGRAIEPDTGPATAAAGGEPFAQLFREFTTAIAIHSGGSGPLLSSDPAYRFHSSVILRGAVKTYSRRMPPYDVRTIVQPGPLDPETFAGNVPTGYASMAAGQTVTLMLLDGGALFVSLAPSPSAGATVRATGAVSGGGSLGQGPLPTPTPASF